MREEIINATGSLSPNVTNTISTNMTNVMSPVSINFDDKKLRYKMNCYTHTISLVIISLLLLVIISTGCYYYHTKAKKKTYCRINMK